MDFSKIFIGGAWRKGGGGLADSINPADGSVVARYGVADVDDVQAAVAAGQKAAADPHWRAMLPHERARILYRIGDAIDAAGDDIAALQTQDTGKTLVETKALAASAANTFRYFAAALETMDEALTSQRGAYLTLSVHEPIGVIGAIAPWNSPIASDAQKIAPALAGGNAVILKPAEWTPLVSLFLAQIIEREGLPKGLLSVLPGPGSVVGDALVRHEGVGKILFTGGTVTGRKIAEIAGRKLMPVTLELGGKSPTIVLDDADIDQAISGILFGIFSSSGQSCIAGSRLFVDRRIYASFMDQLVDRAKGLRIGIGTDAATQVAPLISIAHRDRVAGFVGRAVDEGAQILCGGAAPEGPAYAGGAYYQPTILAGVDPQSEIYREEVFGPVMVAMPFDGDADLVLQANDSVYGLAAGIWSKNFPRAYQLARQLEAGTVWLNCYKQFSISTPFGGWKESGLGLEKGRNGILGNMRQKAVYVGLDQAPHPWA